VNRTRLLIPAAILLASTFPACTGRDGATPTHTMPASGRVLRIAFVEDLAPDGAALRVAPAYEGARLAIDSAELDGALPVDVALEPFDTGGTDGTKTVASRIADDPSIIAAIVAPEQSGQLTLGDRFDAAGLQTISLSSLGPALPAPGWTAWRRAVPDVDREAAALVAALRRVGAARACVIGDDSPASAELTAPVVQALPVRPVLRLALADVEPDDTRVLDRIERASCRTIVWGGSPTNGGVLRLALNERGMRDVRILGGESLKDQAYVVVAGPAGRGTVAVCPCADLSTSTGIRAERFVQDYQSAFGVPPGPFAAEAWDAARMILDAVASGSTTRAGVVSRVSAAPTFSGLARDYAFTGDGSLRPAQGDVRVYLDEGVRWVEDDRLAGT